MAFKVNNLRIPLPEQGTIDIKKAVAKRLRIHRDQIKTVTILHKAVDARRKNNINLVYHVKVEVHGDETSLLQTLGEDKNIQRFEHYPQPSLVRGEQPLRNRPIVVGAGPAGIFAALKLAEYGYRPLILERGKPVDQRVKDIQDFWATGQLNPNSNIQFGEGGAGTFSDGKLTTRIKDTRIDQVYDYLINAGAPEQISYLQKPHIGTDILRRVVVNLRRELQNRGGDIRFDSLVTDLIIQGDRVQGVVVNGREEIMSRLVVLAIGHSARDSYEILYKRNVQLEQKPIAIGVRIEHPQKMINNAQYGKFANHPELGAAEYQLTGRNPETRRAVFSFCMCPGGQVVAAASEPGMVVTNGMSEFNRDKKQANSALVVSIDGKDYLSDHPLAGIGFQRQYEKAAFQLGGGDYQAPAQKVGDFLQGKPSKDVRGKVDPTYKPNVVPANLWDCLPQEVGDTLAISLGSFGRKIKGFDDKDAIMTGVETRTSAPVRIVRGENRQSLNVEGLYPTGEGAGYAGGIVSAAVDGLATAEKIITTYRRPQEL